MRCSSRSLSLQRADACVERADDSLSILERDFEGARELVQRAALERLAAKRPDVPTRFTAKGPVPGAGNARGNAQGRALLTGVQAVVGALDLDLYQGGALVVDRVSG